MGKKSKIAAYKANRAPDGDRVRHIFGNGGWDPLMNGQTEPQNYVKNVKPRSEGQKRLMEAIEKHNLVLAIGPAGTGKTYLAMAMAVAMTRHSMMLVRLWPPTLALPLHIPHNTAQEIRRCHQITVTGPIANGMHLHEWQGTRAAGHGSQDGRPRRRGHFHPGRPAIDWPSR